MENLVTNQKQMERHGQNFAMLIYLKQINLQMLRNLFVFVCFIRIQVVSFEKCRSIMLCKIHCGQYYKFHPVINDFIIFRSNLSTEFSLKLSTKLSQKFSAQLSTELSELLVLFMVRQFYRSKLSMFFYSFRKTSTKRQVLF